MFSYSGISLVDDRVLEGSEMFTVSFDSTTLSPPGSITGALPSADITISGTIMRYLANELVFLHSFGT